ncbi:MAG: SDR family oxidoreductase [Xanthobacteraceae bacterium]|nr:SDR family oxidoreductase [Xanthobacteraceae bacterium]
MANCKGKVALVVGGTRGIGRASALELAAAGATVIPAGRLIEGAEAVAAEARVFGVEAFGLSLDVGDPSASRRAVDEVVSRCGKLDILIANAGISPYWDRAENITPEMWDEVMNVNLRGAFFAVQAAGRQMLKQKSGSIVSISSVTAVFGVSRGLPYVATKGGMDSMTRSLAVEWAPYVRVNGVAPGFVATDMTHGMQQNEGLKQSVIDMGLLGRLAEPEEIAPTVVLLASDAGSFITGQTFIVDGGMAAGRDSGRRTSRETSITKGNS